jgi:anionic cell wall polymer biosynthesis LytR-Cps2A-Psr (LCP) family protein
VLFRSIPRQNQVIKGLRSKVLSPAILLRIPDLFNQFRYGTTTDLSVQQILNLTCMVGEVPMEAVSFDTINPNMVNIQPDGSMLMIDKEIVKKQFISVFGPESPK